MIAKVGGGSGATIVIIGENGTLVFFIRSRATSASGFTVPLSSERVVGLSKRNDFCLSRHFLFLLGLCSQIPHHRPVPALCYF